MVSLAMRQVLVGAAAVVVMLGWLQLAPAFGFPVTAPAPMLDRMLGAHREAGPAGWALLLLATSGIAAAYFVLVEGRARAAVVPFLYGFAAWLLSGAALMPLVGLIQGAPPAGDLANDPMRANFFMLNLGPGAAAESLVGWLLFGAVLGAGRTMELRRRGFLLAVGAGVLAAAIAWGVPALVAKGNPARVVDSLVALPAGPLFISFLELPQSPGAVLGPHVHVAGFVYDVSGTATTVLAAGGVVNVGAGDALSLASLQKHAHQNREAVPLAISLAVVIVVLTAVLAALRGRRYAAVMMATLLVAGIAATVNPLMNDWYFIGVRGVAARGPVMPVPAGHKTYESENLSGVQSGPYVERLTTRPLGDGESVDFAGPGAVVVLDGEISITTGGRTVRLSSRSGATISGGDHATVLGRSGGARVLALELLPGG